MITDYTDNDYPTLPFKVRASGYSTTNSNDFTFTEFNGAPGRGRASFLNGWKYAQVQILLKNEYDQFAWQTFYDMDYNGTSGGIQKGVMPCFIECELGGQFGKFLCLIANPEWKKSSYQGKTSVLTLSVQVRPEIIGDDGACKKEVFESFIACGVKPSDFSNYLQGFKKIAEVDMNPINYYSRLVFDFNGIDDFITIPQCDLVSGDIVSFKFLAPMSHAGFRVFAHGAASGSLLWIDSSGKLRPNHRASLTMDGIAIVDQVTDLPLDGLEHEVVATFTTAGDLNTIGRNNTTSADYIDFPIYDVGIQAVSGNRFYSIDKKGWTIQNQKIVNLLDESGDTDGESVNFTEDGWIEIEIK